MPTMHVIITDALSAAFTEWMRWYREDPTQFETDWLEGGTDATTYGEQASAYLLKLLRSQHALGTLTMRADYVGPETRP